ncbi:MAG: LysM peptidoglycan-binding domain-containing protein [Porticoccaceae bacterium]
MTPVPLEEVPFQPEVLYCEADSDILTELQTGLIEELASEFTWDRHLDHSAVSRRLAWYQENPEQLEYVLERATMLLPILSREVRERGLPAELVFLPLIESGFQPSVYSRAGAAGLWQLMPATARSLGLRIDWWYDERLDILASTDKALDYLVYLNQQFGGNWELTIAAYNGGEGHVRARMRRGQSQNFWNLPLKRETEQYVPRLLAVAEVLSNPDKYGINVPFVGKEPLLLSMPLDEQIDLRLAAEVSGLDYQQFKWLNPDFQRWISPPDGEYSLLLPAGNMDYLMAGMDDLKPDTDASWDHYRVRPGDTLGHIAYEFGTTVSALKAINQLSGSIIYARQELLIPKSASQKSNPESAMKELYIVKRGDSLWLIANRNGISLAKLKRLNALNDNSLLQPGQVLVLNEYTQQQTDATTYEVKNGDSLSVIADQFNVALTDLMQWNSLGSSDLIHPGQILKIRNI